MKKLLLLLLVNQAMADEFIGYGMGVWKSATHHIGEVKTFNLGATSDLIGPFSQKVELGVWTDIQKQLGRKSSGYGSWGLGSELIGRPFKLSSYFSVVGITTKDSYLGSTIQFSEDICAGISADKNNSSISICIKHISNANLFSKINTGRDFLTIKLGF
jgi:hypothetical protein